MLFQGTGNAVFDVLIVIGLLFALLLPLVGIGASIILMLLWGLELFTPLQLWIMMIGLIIIIVLYVISLPAAWGNVLQIIPLVIFLIQVIGNLFFGPAALATVIGIFAGLIGLGYVRGKNVTEDNPDVCIGLSSTKKICLLKGK